MDFMDLVETAGEVVEGQKNEVRAWDPMDPARVISLFDRFHGEIDKMANQASQVVVTDAQYNERALGLSLQVKTLIDRLERKRQEVKEPYLKVTRVLDSEVKDLRNRLSTIKAGIDGKIRAWMQEEQRKRDEERRKLEEQRRQEQARVDAERRRQAEEAAAAARRQAEEEARQRGVDEAAAREAAAKAEQEARLKAEREVPPVQIVLPEVAPAAAVVDSGSAKLKTKTVWRISDFRKLPQQCLESRAAMIEKAVAPWINSQMKAGVTDISGVEFYEEQILETRINRGA